MGCTVLPMKEPTRKRAKDLTYWVHGVLGDDMEGMLDLDVWTRIDPEEPRPPFFARYRRTCKNPVIKAGRIRPFPYATCLSYCCDKKLFYQSMAASGYSQSVPETYLNFECLKRAAATNEQLPSRPVKGEVWYVKTSDGCHGRGVQVFDDFKGLKTHVRSLHNEPYVIQRGVSNLSLLEGKKWTIRAHILVTPDLRILRHRDGVIIVHSENYVPGATERAIQILHNRHATRHSLLDGPASHLVPTLEPQIDRIAFEVCDCIRGRLYRATAAASVSLPDATPASYYALLGVDLLVDAQNVVHCLEVNEFPQLDFTNDPAAHEVVVDTFRGVLHEVVYPLAGLASNEETGWVAVGEQLNFSAEIEAERQAKAKEVASNGGLLSPFGSKPRRKDGGRGAGPGDRACGVGGGGGAGGAGPGGVSDAAAALPHSTDAEKALMQADDPEFQALVSPKAEAAASKRDGAVERVRRSVASPPAAAQLRRARVERVEREDTPTSEGSSSLSSVTPPSEAAVAAAVAAGLRASLPATGRRLVHEDEEVAAAAAGEQGGGGGGRGGDRAPVPPRVVVRTMKPREVLRMHNVGVRVAHKSTVSHEQQPAASGKQVYAQQSVLNKIRLFKRAKYARDAAGSAPAYGRYAKHGVLRD